MFYNEYDLRMKIKEVGRFVDPPCPIEANEKIVGTASTRSRYLFTVYAECREERALLEQDAQECGGGISCETSQAMVWLDKFIPFVQSELHKQLVEDAGGQEGVAIRNGFHLVAKRSSNHSKKHNAQALTATR